MTKTGHCLPAEASPVQNRAKQWPSTSRIWHCQGQSHSRVRCLQSHLWIIILWSLAFQHTLQIYTWIYFLLQASLWTYLCWISCTDFGSSFQHVDFEFAFCLLLYWQPQCCLLQKHEVGFPRPSSLARSMTEAPEDLCPFRNSVWCFPRSVLKICREHKMIPLWDGSRLKKKKKYWKLCMKKGSMGHPFCHLWGGVFDPQKKQCKCYCLLGHVGGLLSFSFMNVHRALITRGKGSLCYEKQSQRLNFSKRYIVLALGLLHCVVMNNTWKQMSKASVLSGNSTFFPFYV